MSDAPSTHNSGDNVPVFSVTEVSGLVKSTVEGAFSHVRIRGEISGFKRAASGHLYFTLKDDSAVIDGVCWRTTAGRLALNPEDGMEIIATGRITTYAGRSKYQLVVEQMELAGEGRDVAVLPGAQADYSFSREEGRLVADGPQGIVRMVQVEALRFAQAPDTEVPTAGL